MRSKNITFLSVTLLLALVQFAVAQDFVHPGGLHTQKDLDRMKEKVAAKEHPWIDGWNALIRDRKAQANYESFPQRHMISRQRAQEDATAAYLNALRWQVSGDDANAQCAVRILNAWSRTMNDQAHGPDQPGLGGIPSGSFAVAAELLRTYPGWSAADQQRFNQMLLKYLYPACHDFLTRHNGAADDKWWANWDTCNMLAVLAIGVFCDDRPKFDEAIEYFKHGKGRGSILNAVPFRYSADYGQWQESGRDQAHTMGGMGLLAEMCQVAWNQGVDLFGYDNNRLLAGAEYAAQYTLWKGVPYTFYTNSDHANQYYISQNYHGRLDTSHFELLYNHYVVRCGLKAPNVQRLAELRRPEPGEADVFGYGTLTFTLDAQKSPYPAFGPPPTPLDLTATAGIDRVDLRWSPSGAYNAHGYEVSRATSSEGPYQTIHASRNWTTPLLTDTNVVSRKVYFYRVAARNNSGQSGPSEPVSATPLPGGPLPQEWNPGKAGAEFANLAGGSFVIHCAPDDGSFTFREITGDFTLTACLINRQGKIKLAGIMMREGTDKDASFAAMTVGEAGQRQAKFRSRSEHGGSVTTQGGDDYTWLPVWFRLQRLGGTITAFQSSDGIEWFEVGRSRVAMAEKCLVGLLANGESDGKSKASFARVRGEPSPPAPPAAPVSLASTSEPDCVKLTWKKPSGVDSCDGIKVEASIDGAPFCEIADLVAEATCFTNTGLKKTGAICYRIRAYNQGGYSDYSNITPSR